MINNQHTVNCKLRNKVLGCPNSSGIYFLIHPENRGKFYVGSSVNIKRRILYHLTKLRANTHENILLQRVYNKYKDLDLLYFVTKDIKKATHLEKAIINSNPALNISQEASRPPIHKGNKHHFFDSKIYTLANKTGEVVKGTRLELVKVLNLDASNLKKLIQQKRKSIKGYSLK